MAAQLLELKDNGALSRVVKSARLVLNGDLSFLAVETDGTLAIIDLDGLTYGYNSSPISFASLKLDQGQILDISDVQSEDHQSTLDLLFSSFGTVRSAFIASVPTTMVGRAFIIVLGLQPREQLSTEQHWEMQSYVELAGDILGLIDKLSKPDILLQARALAFDAVTIPLGLVSKSGIYLDVNNSLAALNGMTKEEHVGKSLEEVIPDMATASRKHLRRAIETGQPVINVEFELPSAETGGEPRPFAISIYPNSSDGEVLDRAYFVIMDLQAHAVYFGKRRDQNQQAQIANSGFAENSPLTPNPSAGFILDTLVKQPKLRSRKGSSYTTLRTWRAGIKDSQIVAMRHMKKAADANFINSVAEEIATHVKVLVGAAAIDQVVPVPGGHTVDMEPFSVSIARQVAKLIGSEFVEAVSSPPRKGSSHPRKSSRLPKLIRTASVSGTVLVVDDIASSGAHLEQVGEALKGEADGLFKVAWIGPSGR